jgi:hypothetical protein
VPPPAPEARRSAIVTARRPGKRYVEVPEEEHQRRGDAAEALFRELVRGVATNNRS